MREELKQVLTDVLEVDTISDDDSVRTIPSWDSVRHLNLILALEERFGLEFDADRIPDLISVRAIAAALEDHGRTNAGGTVL
jgi:acyl carrier protein